MNLSKPHVHLLTRSLLAGCLSLASWAAPAQLMAPTSVNYAPIDQKIRQAAYSEAWALTEQALRMQPNDPKLLFWKAWTQEKMGMQTQALAGYKALTQDHPELPEPHNNLGVLLLRQGDLEGAQMAFQEALRMDAQYAEAMENLADVYLMQARGLYVRALQTSRRKERLEQKIKALPLTPQP